MQKGWIACACVVLTVACADQRSSGSEQAGQTASVRAEALLGSGVSAEVLLGQPVSSPAYFETLGPLSISADPNGFLVTWIDSRERKVINSSPNAQLHVVSTHVSSSGVVENPSGSILSTGVLWGFSGGDYAQAHSAFNGQHYLVAWHKLRPATNPIETNFTDPSEIYAVRMSTTGEVMDAAPFVVSARPAGDSSSVATVLSKGSEFFVAWSGENTSAVPGQVQSRTLSFTGSEPVLGSVTTYPFSGSDPTKYAFISNGLGYIAASVNAGNTGFTVGTLNHDASSDCSASASPSIDAVALGSNGVGETLVAYRGRVVPQNGSCAVGTKAVLIGADGLQKAPPISLGASSALPAVSYLNGKYFVAGFQIDPATNVASPAGSSVPSTIACNASACLGAVGTGVSRLSPAGAQLDVPPIVVSSPAREQRAPYVVAGAGKYLVVWSEQPFDSRDIAIHAGRLDAAGARLDPTPALIAANGYVLDVGFNGTDFVVLWFVQQPSNAYSLRLTRLSPTGVVKDPSGIELNPAVGSAWMACAATDCLVAWTPSNWTVPAPPSVTYATRVAANGTMLDQPAIQLLPTTSIMMLAAAGSGYVMQYSSPPQSGVSLLQKLDAEGHAVGASLTVGGSPQTLRPCGSGYFTRTFVLVGNTFTWFVSMLDSNAQVVQSHVDLGGVPIWEPIPSASTTNGCVVAWAQGASDSWDIYANVLNGDGTRLRPTALPIAVDKFNKFYPALAVGADGKILTAYSHFVAQAPYGNSLIATRVVDPAAFAPEASGGGGAGGESTGSGGSIMTGGTSGVGTSGGGSTATGGSTSTGGSSAGGISGGESTGTAGSTPTAGNSGTGALGGETAGGGGLLSMGGTTASGGIGGEAVSGEGGEPGAGGLDDSTPSEGGASATAGAVALGGASDSSAGATASAGTTQGAAGASGKGGGGHGSGCAASSRRAPEHAAVPTAFLLLAFAGWRRSRRTARGKERRASRSR